MILARIAVAIAVALLAPTLAMGQGVDEGDGKISNDDPGRPLQMAPASTETKEALDDFDRFQRRGAWERALKALYTIPDDQALRFVDGADGFIIPVARKRRDVLAAMPPEGRAAYRLFYDAEARKLFDEAEGDDEQAKLERIYSAYFTTTVGDDAADRLGDLYFERGRFDRAADCWLSVLSDHPDTDLSPAALATKAALALYRAGRTSEFDQIRAELADRHQGETVTLGGRSAAPLELLESLIGDESPGAVSQAGPDDDAPLALDSSTEPDWMVAIADSIEAGMTATELDQWRSSTLSDASPASSIDGSRLYLNHLGHILAIDLQTGKLLWRSSALHELKTLTNSPVARMIDPGRFAILARGEFLWCATRDLKDPNYNASFRLECRRAVDGEIVWKSADLPEIAPFEPSGAPILNEGTLLVAAESQQGQSIPGQWVLAIRPRDGKLIWKTQIGSLRQGRQRFSYGQSQSSPRPTLLLDAGSLYIDTQLGVLARLDAESGSLEWGFGYQTESAQGSIHFFNPYQQAEPVNAGGGPIPLGDSLLVKGAQSSRIYVVDPNRMTLKWERAIGQSARPLAADDHSIYLGGDDLGALDIQTRNLNWATRLPGGSGSGAVLVRPDAIRQMTSRGVFEIDPATGDVRSIFRGADLGASAGADLLLTADRLLTVSNRAIAAYPRGADASSTTQEKTPR